MDTKDLIARELERRIQCALTPGRGHPTPRITVAVRGRRATLKGEVGSWAEHEAAEEAALATPGVVTVDNEICLMVKAKLSPVG
jgi:osmotically-inducible protein OsmY